MRVLRTAFNAGQYVLAAAAGGRRLHDHRRGLSGLVPTSGRLLAVLLAAVAHNVVNHGS
jgi:hypothetical protein